MRKVIRALCFPIVSGLFLLLYSCTPQSCFEPTESSVKASLYLNRTGLLTAPDSITVYGIGLDTNRLYNKTNGISIAKLPLNPATSHCSFIIRINGVTDTLEFYYSSYPHLVSKECGYTFYQNLFSDSISCTSNIIDSVYVRNNNITTLNEENIRIFY